MESKYKWEIKELFCFQRHLCFDDRKEDATDMCISSQQHVKVLINSTHMATSYEDITVEEGSKINTDMILSKRHLYVLMDRRIYKVKFQECQYYTTCLSCVDDGYCGWYVRNQTCGLKDDFDYPCSDNGAFAVSIKKEARMFSRGMIGMQQRSPCCGIAILVFVDEHLKNISELAVPDLLLHDQRMEACLFSGRNVNITTKATIYRGLRLCETPLSNQIPPIQIGNEITEMTLFGLFSGKMVQISKVLFYDCGLYTSCTSCTIPYQFYCYWCTKNHACITMEEGCPDNNYVSFDETDLCPRITFNETEILVPSETNTTIVVSALNLKDFQTPFTCFFHLDNGRHVNAKVTRRRNRESIIECELIHFSYEGDANESKVPFHISWANLNNILDNPGNIQVIMYKCDKMADSCFGCLTLTNQYKCGWCDGTCTIQSQCSSRWLSSSETCPNPEIITIEPTSVPKDGGTYITITGKNLGKRFEDISSIYIEHSTRVQCTPMKHRYIAPMLIVCVSGASPITGTGTLIVTINNKYNATASNIIFSYVNPVVVEISPVRGPKSGGTLVTLSGNDMNTGNNRTVLIGNHSCEVENFNSTALTCITSMASDTMVKEQLRLRFDEQIVTSNITYEYTTDPTIINIDPKVAIGSGGIKIDVTGTQLDIIKEPKMVLWYGDTKIEGECKVANAALMHCYSPQVKSLNSNCSINSAMKDQYSYGFILDNVKEVLNLTKKNKDKFETFSIVSDPIFQPLTRNLDKTYQYEPNSDLIINATCLNGVLARDVTVLIGKDFCSKIAVGQFQITCKPPKDKPKSQQESASPEVIVKIGHNFSEPVGYLRYELGAVPDASNAAILYLVIGLAVGVVVLVIIIIVVILVLRKREKNMKKKLQIQLDNLELRVAKEYNEDNTDISGVSAPAVDKSTLAVLNDARLIINRNRLRLGDIIGKGHYGCVLKGYLLLPGDNEDKLVAIKTLHKKNLRDIDLDAFLREIMIMKEFHHPNVLRLLGICLGQNDIPSMVLPFMEHGDLLSYIRDDTNTPTVTDLIHFGIGIAEGMAYLSDHKFVHRDLAARNCMLDEELNVKVADFGLSREIYEREYYTSDNKKVKLPIRWMAPESMEKGTYSSKSDVWSYGVVLWELMTKGVTPYPEVDNWDIVRYLRKGRRLPRPQYCPDKVYDIMQKCWLVDPQDRPTFSVLARKITDMLSVAEHDMQQGLLKIDIHCAQFNEADSAKYHYAYNDTYLKPPKKTEPIGGANSGNDCMEVYDDTNDVQIYPMGGAKGNNKNEPYHYAYNDAYLEPPTNTEHIGGANSGNDYIEVLDDTNDVQIDPAGGANGNNKNKPYHYAYDDSNLEPPTKSEPVDGATNNYMQQFDGSNDVQIDPPGGANNNNKHAPCHDERVSFDVDAPGKLPENI